MSAEEDPTVTAADDTSTDDDPTPSPCPFTMKIINVEGTHYYQIESSNLGPAMKIADADMQAMVDNHIGLNHVPFGEKPWSVALCGTFFVNLSIYKP